jgi:hypothetical protein
MLDKNTLLTLNKNPGSVDLHKLALAKMKNAKVSPESKHEYIADRMRNKSVGDMDEAFKKFWEAHKNGTLRFFLEKHGASLGYVPVSSKSLKESNTLLNSNLLENSNVGYKIDQLLETVAPAFGGGAVASGVGPIASLGGGEKNVRSSYAKPTLMKEDCTTQDPGAETKCKK